MRGARGVESKSNKTSSLRNGIWHEYASSRPFSPSSFLLFPTIYDSYVAGSWESVYTRVNCTPSQST